MPRIDPWAQQYKRPAPALREVLLKDPDWTLVLREPAPGERDVIRDRQLELTSVYVTGEANVDGQPVPLTTPTVPAERVKVSKRLMNYAAALETLVVSEEGEEPPTLLEIIGWQRLDHQWPVITKAVDDLWFGAPGPSAGGNSTGPTPDTGKSSASA